MTFKNWPYFPSNNSTLDEFTFQKIFSITRESKCTLSASISFLLIKKKAAHIPLCPNIPCNLTIRTSINLIPVDTSTITQTRNPLNRQENIRINRIQQNGINNSPFSQFSAFNVYIIEQKVIFRWQANWVITFINDLLKCFFFFLLFDKLQLANTPWEFTKSSGFICQSGAIVNVTIFCSRNFQNSTFDKILFQLLQSILRIIIIIIPSISFPRGIQFSG